jgi:hypothetical protein
MRKEVVKKSRNEVILKMKEGIPTSHQKVGLFGKVWV